MSVKLCQCYSAKCVILTYVKTIKHTNIFIFLTLCHLVVVVAVVVVSSDILAVDLFGFYLNMVRFSKQCKLLPAKAGYILNL